MMLIFDWPLSPNNKIAKPNFNQRLQGPCFVFVQTVTTCKDVFVLNVNIRKLSVVGFVAVTVSLTFFMDPYLVLDVM